jgi:hypothetical protein
LTEAVLLAPLPLLLPAPPYGNAQTAPPVLTTVTGGKPDISVVVGCIREEEKCYTEMKYKNTLIERGALQEPPYPAMGGECPLLPTEDNEAQKDAGSMRAEWTDEALREKLFF